MEVLLLYNILFFIDSAIYYILILYYKIVIFMYANKLTKTCNYLQI